MAEQTSAEKQAEFEAKTAANMRAAEAERKAKAAEKETESQQ